MTTALLSDAERAQFNDEADAQGVQWSDDGPFPKLSSPALYGVIGDIVKALLPHTEASAPALLFQGLGLFGVLASEKNNYCRVGGGRHRSNIFTAIIGPTSTGRKGQSLNDISEFFKVAMPEEFQLSVMRDIASGEALVASVCDEYEDGVLVEKHKRKMVTVTEFSSVFASGERKGSTLSAKLRQAYDGEIANETKKDRMAATQAVIGLIGHMTQNELHEVCKPTDITGGLANRILWVCSQRSKLLPSGGNLSFATIRDFASLLNSRITNARILGQIRRSDAAELVWDRLYRQLDSEAQNEDGLIGDVLGRGQANLLRISLVYALSDASQIIEIKHLRAAWYALRYCEASARYIFGARLSASKSIKLLEAARAAHPHGLNGRAQNEATGGRGTKEARENLLRRGLVRVETAPVPVRGGNPPVTIFAEPIQSNRKQQNDIHPVDEGADAYLFTVTDADVEKFRAARKSPAEVAIVADFAEDADNDREVVKP